MLLLLLLLYNENVLWWIREFDGDVLGNVFDEVAEGDDRGTERRILADASEVERHHREFVRSRIDIVELENVVPLRGEAVFSFMLQNIGKPGSGRTTETN